MVIYGNRDKKTSKNFIGMLRFLACSFQLQQMVIIFWCLQTYRLPFPLNSDGASKLKFVSLLRAPPSRYISDHVPIVWWVLMYWSTYIFEVTVVLVCFFFLPLFWEFGWCMEPLQILPNAWNFLISFLIYLSNELIIYKGHMLMHLFVYWDFVRI